MLVRLEDQMQHFPRRRAAFVQKFGAYCEQLGKRKLDDAVEILPVVSTLETIDPADCQHAVKTGKDLICVARVQELHGDV